MLLLQKHLSVIPSYLHKHETISLSLVIRDLQIKAERCHFIKGKLAEHVGSMMITCAGSQLFLILSESWDFKVTNWLKKYIYIYIFII